MPGNDRERKRREYAESLIPSPSDAPNLAARLGEANYARRLRLEAEREAEFHAILSTKFTWMKVHLLRPSERMILKCIGLWRLGRRGYFDLKVVENEVRLGEKLPKSFDGFRIAHLTDLHIDMDDALVPLLAKALEETDYDLCVMTGDYRNLTVGGIARTVELMQRLAPSLKAPAYLVPGNHDFLAEVPPMERTGKYRFLLNESVRISRTDGDGALWLCGVDDPAVFRTHDIGRASAGIDSGGVRVLLAHSPRVYRAAESAGFDLLLAGHTHGGQVCLPGGRAVMNNDATPRAYQKGAWRHGKMIGYTSCGCGATGLPIRINCPPEIAVHVLRR